MERGPGGGGLRRLNPLPHRCVHGDMSDRRLPVSLALCAVALAACSGGAGRDVTTAPSGSPIATASSAAPTATPSGTPSKRPAATATTTPTAAATRLATTAPPVVRTTTTPRPSATKTSAKPTPTSTAPAACPNNTSATSLTMVNSGASYAFSPSSLSVMCGGTVHITNNSTAPHTMSPSKGGFTGTGTVDPAMTASVRFSYRGTYGFFCSIHTYMTGTVTVT